MPPTVDATKGSVNQATSEVAPDFCIGNKYHLRNVVHVDSKTYVSTNTLTGEKVAVKLELVHTKHPQVEYETSVCQKLAGGIGVPSIHWSGLEGDFHVMVSDLLGPSLEEVFNSHNRKFSLKTVLLLADQLISRIEYIHGKSFLHRCIGPESFYLGRGILRDRVNVANFSLAKTYSSSTGFHIPYVENMSFGGIARYASPNVHNGIEYSRRDDMVSLGYVLLYFCRGSLPWQSLGAPTKEETFIRIKEKKRDILTETLCRGLPEEFLEYLDYTLSLRFDETPDYYYLRQIFQSLFQREFQFDHVFDWRVPGTAFLLWRGSDILAQPKEEALATKVDGICADLVNLENECSKAAVNDEDLQTLMASHRFLLHDYYNYFRSSHHSSSSHKLPTRVWRNGIDSFIKLLITKLPGSFDHLLEFLRLVYSMTISLFETTRSLQWIWTEVLGDISKYWMSFCNCELDIWSGMASYWYEKAASISPNSGRIQHHLAAAAKHNIVRELFYYSKALVSVEPFTPGRESMDLFCARVLSSQAVGRPWTVERTFVKAQALLFKRSSISLFDKMIGVFISGIDTHASCERDLFQRQGPEMACILFAALLEAGCASQSLDKRKQELPGTYEAMNGGRTRRGPRTWAAQLPATIP